MTDLDLTWEEFEKVQIVAGTIERAEEFAEARKPAYKLWVNIGTAELKQSSAQVTDLYTKEELIGKQVVCVINFAPMRIAGFKSEVLVTGFYQEDGSVVLATPDKPLHNGAKLG